METLIQLSEFDQKKVYRSVAGLVNAFSQGGSTSHYLAGDGDSLHFFFDREAGRLPFDEERFLDTLRDALLRYPNFWQSSSASRTGVRNLNFDRELKTWKTETRVALRSVAPAGLS